MMVAPLSAPALFLSFFLSTASHALGATPCPIPGPVYANLVRVHDGDTIVVHADPWPGLTAAVYVRIAEINAPELNKGDKESRAQGHNARRFVESMLNPERPVLLRNIRYGKYARRVVADVEQNGVNVGVALLRENLAKPDAYKYKAQCAPSKARETQSVAPRSPN